MSIFGITTITLAIMSGWIVAGVLYAHHMKETKEWMATIERTAAQKRSSEGLDCKTCQHNKPMKDFPRAIFCRNQGRFYDEPYGCIKHLGVVEQGDNS